MVYLHTVVWNSHGQLAERGCFQGNWKSLVVGCFEQIG